MRAILSASAALSLAAIVTAQGSPAAYTSFGTGCPAPDSWYELFDDLATPPSPGDLAGTSLLFTFNGSGYTVTAGGAFDPGFTNNLMLGDDELSQNHPLGFSLPVPGTGRSTDAIDVDSNGWLGMFTGEHSGTDVTESVSDLLNGPPRIALWWDDLDPSAGGGVYFDALATHTMVTYDQVPSFGATNTNTCQIQFYPNGDLVMVWVTDCDTDGMVGFSAGNGSPDPGGIDISASVPFAFGPSLPAIGLSGMGLPLLGGTINMDVTNIPSRATAGVLNLGLSGATPVDLTPIGMPFCTDYISGLLIGTLAVVPTANPTATLPVTIPMDATLAGATATVQAIIVAPGINALGVGLSNAGELLLGDRGPVTVAANGANSFNAVTSSGYFSVVNDSGMTITGVQFDFFGSSNPNQSTMVFDTDQTGMADRFDGGNSTTAGCLGTYRNLSDALCGLDYLNSTVSACDPNALTGWVGTNGTTTNNWSTLDFAFVNFTSGKTFEFDADTDGGQGIGGGDMEGMVVTITFQGGMTVSGELVRQSATLSSINL